MSLREPERSCGKALGAFTNCYMNGQNPDNLFFSLSGRLHPGAQLYKTLDCFRKADDKLFPTCGFSFMPALLGFAWLYSVSRKEVGILKSCCSQIL